MNALKGNTSTELRAEPTRYAPIHQAVTVVNANLATSILIIGHAKVKRAFT